MASGKRPWFTQLCSSVTATVSWGCADTSTRNNTEHDPGAEWARFVQLITTLDGRDVVTRLTPSEARNIATAMIYQANRVDAMNLAHQNGGVYPDESPWAKVETL